MAFLRSWFPFSCSHPRSIEYDIAVATQPLVDPYGVANSLICLEPSDFKTKISVCWAPLSLGETGTAALFSYASGGPVALAGMQTRSHIAFHV